VHPAIRANQQQRDGQELIIAPVDPGRPPDGYSTKRTAQATHYRKRSGEAAKLAEAFKVEPVEQAEKKPNAIEEER